MAIAERKEAAAKGLAQLYEGGALRSSRTMVMVGELVADEFMVRAQIAWQTLLRALATQPEVVTTELKTHLLAEIDRVLNAESQDVVSLVNDARVRANATGDWEPFIAKRRKRALDWAESEMEFALLEATSKHAKGPDRATFNFYGTVGAVLTGPGAAASVSISAEQRHSVVNAINAVKQAVVASEDLPPVFSAICDIAQSRYLLAVAREFFEDHPTPAAIVAQIETRFVARELRDHPNRWLLLPRLGPPAPID